MTFALSLLACVVLAAREEVRRAEIELSGPLEAVLVRPGAGFETRIEGPLGAGDVRRVVAPISIRSSVPPRVSLEVEDRGENGGGAARFLRWLPSPERDPQESWPRGMAFRGRPPIGKESVRPTLAGLLALAAAFLASLALARRRPRSALAAGLLGAAAALFLGVQPPARGQRVRVLEGDARVDAWLLVESGYEELSMPPIEPLLLETQPEGREGSWTVRGSWSEEGPRWIFEARAARITRVAPLDTRGHWFREEANGWGRLERAWVRGARGPWQDLGSWGYGEALPAADRDASAPGNPPPGWLAAALPPGVPVLLGRLSSEGFLGPVGPPAGGSSPPGEVWVRLVGFPGGD